MREIKFRAWIKERDFVGIIQDAYMAIQGTPDLETLQSFMHHYGDESTLMQYTGLKDKNGNEICEGDIINVDNSEPEENGEYDITTICKWDIGCFVLEDNAGGHWTRQLFHKPHRLTIIGNIYQNPDILTQ